MRSEAQLHALLLFSVRLIKLWILFQRVAHSTAKLIYNRDLDDEMLCCKIVLIV